MRSTNNFLAKSVHSKKEALDTKVTHSSAVYVDSHPVEFYHRTVCLVEIYILDNLNVSGLIMIMIMILMQSSALDPDVRQLPIKLNLFVAIHLSKNSSN
jgi:hypothetical protein